MQAAFALSGWLTAGLIAAAGLAARRSRAATMEAAARASHELRGPITAARLGVQLGMRAADLSPASLRAIDLELRRASLALEDLSNVERRPHEARDREAVDLAELLADSVEAASASASARGAQVVLRWVGAPIYVWGDRLRLGQAVGNLIANAIEHGGGRIEVRGRADHSGARVEVSDGGAGLPAPVAELTKRAHGGRGTRGRGLAIAAAIAQDHGGRLAAAPSERGARLCLELPRTVAEPSASPRPDGIGSPEG